MTRNIGKGDIWSSSEVARICNVPLRLVDFWARMEVVVPMVPASGIGSARIYNFEDLIAMNLLAQCPITEIAIKKKIVARVREAWRANPAVYQDSVLIEFSPAVHLRISLYSLAAELREKLERYSGESK